MKKKLLVLLMTLAIILSMIPVTALADNPECGETGHVHNTGCQVDESGNVYYYDADGKTQGIDETNFVVSASKTITALNDENEFEITLKVKTTVDTEKIDVSPDAAVVLVIDISGSMNTTLPDSTKTRLEAAKEAAIEFLDSFIADAGDAVRMVSIVTFNGNGTGTTNDPYKGYSEVALGWTNVSSGANIAKNKIDSLVASLGTFTQGGLMLARNLYLPANAPKDTNGDVIENRFVILLTDGNPTHMLGTRTSTGSGQNIVYTYTNDISYNGISSLNGNLLNGVEAENTSSNNLSSVSAARGAATSVATQIKNGGFNSNYTARLYTIGFGLSDIKYANTYGGTGSYTGDEWLKNVIASAPNMHFTTNNISNLKFAFEKISEIITRMANAWIVTDPMAKYIAYDSQNVISDSNNTAKFNDGVLVWSIKDSEPTSVEEVQRGAALTKIFTYELKYKISLDNLTGYKAENIIPTNDKTTLTYVVDSKKADQYNDEDFITAIFTIPEIHGYDTSFTFTKIGEKDDRTLEGAKFGLWIGDAITAVPFMTAISDENGTVSFKGIPSGHAYTLKEIEAPDGYLCSDDEYSVAVSYGEIVGIPIIGNKISNEKIIITPGSKISIAKMVFANGENSLIADWLISEGHEFDIADILNDITFELYASNAAGDVANDAEPIDICTIGLDSKITFNSVHPSGWYLVREKLGLIASEIYKEDIPDLLIYFDAAKETVTESQGPEFNENSPFTIEQFNGADVSRPIQVVYKAKDGTTFGLRQVPKLDVVGSPNGGGALTTLKFIATDDNGNKYTSFCADSGAVGVRGTYYIDKTNHGFSEEEMQWLVAVLDYVYSNYDFEEYESIAIAQLVVWNMIIKYNGPAISDLWLRDRTEDGTYYKYYSDRFGEISKIEAVNYNNGAKLWSNEKAANNIVNAILGNPNYYLELYNAKIKAGTERYVSNAIFLKGNPSSLDNRLQPMMYGDLNIYQQRQLILVFADPAIFNNEPSDNIFHGTETIDFGALEATVDVKAYKDEYKWIPGKQTTKSGTLVTYVGLTDAKKNAGGYNADGDYIDGAGGGFTAIAVNVNGLNNRTFYISNSGHGNPKFQEEKDKIALTYTVEVINGNIIVTFDENFVSAQIAYGVYTKISDIKWSPGQYNVSKGHINNTSGVIQIPLPANAGEVAYLAIHISSVTYSDGSGKSEYIGRKGIPYQGTLKLMITESDGTEYGPYDLTDYSDGTLFKIDEMFKKGEYNITLSGDGFNDKTITVSVTKDETISVDFGTIIIII